MATDITDVTDVYNKRVKVTDVGWVEALRNPTLSSTPNFCCYYYATKPIHFCHN